MKNVEQIEKAFLIKMIAHHQAAVEMSNMFLQDAETPELINFAKNIIEVQTAEIIKMQKWLQVWF